jgi:hypothetical protein
MQLCAMQTLATALQTQTAIDLFCNLSTVHNAAVHSQLCAIIQSQIISASSPNKATERFGIVATAWLSRPVADFVLGPVTAVLQCSREEDSRSVDALFREQQAIIAATGVLRYLLTRFDGSLPGGFGEVVQGWLQGGSGAKEGLAGVFEELVHMAEEAERVGAKGSGEETASLGLLSHAIGCVVAACMDKAVDVEGLPGDYGGTGAQS